jgi:hypothetical protein
MAVRMLDDKISLDLLKEELDYTLARLRHDADAKDLAAPLQPLVARLKEARLAQWDHWEHETEAQAQVDAANDALDALSEDLLHDLVHQYRDWDSPQLRRYFPGTPSALIQLALETQLERCRSWPQMLAGEGDATLKAYADGFTAAIAAGDEAIAARRTAATARATHRLNAIGPLFADVNAARQTLYGTLVQRGVERHRGRRWATSFFRAGTRAPRREPETN